MKIPLMLHFKPRIGVGPTVMLEKGKWAVESNHKDSVLEIILDGQTYSFLPDSKVHKLDIGEDAPICIHIKEAGSEPQLTIYAVLLGTTEI